MSIITSAKQFILTTCDSFKQLSLFTKVSCVVILVALFGGAVYYGLNSQTKTVTYQTAKVTKGTLTTSISGTGTISSGNSTNITTGSTGTVKEVFVTNGDMVTKGQKIAELTLDDYGIEQQATAWSNYIDTLNAVKAAKAAKDGYDIQMWQARQDILDAEDAINTKNLSPTNPKTNKEWTLSERTIVDKSLEKARKDYSAAEDKYKNADAAIAKASAKVTAALRDYQEVSSTITAPIEGTVNNLSLAKGVIISSSSTSKTATSTTSTSTDTSNTITSQKIGKIYSTDGQLQATVSLTEADITTITPNQKVILTLDAYSNKTFNGKVLAVDTSGSVTSGVTTYPVTILMDKTETAIYPNMAVSVQIITSVKSDVLLIKTGAIDAENNKTVVHVLKSGKVSSISVTTGGSDEAQTEITKGLSEGDIVITNYISASDPSQNNTSSAFSSTSKTNTKNSKNSGGGGMGGGMMGGPPGM